MRVDRTHDHADQTRKRYDANCAAPAAPPRRMPEAATPLADLGIRGVFLNLDRSVQRRRALEEQLSAIGLAGDYERFAALEGASCDRGGSPLTPGEIGCFRSHMEVLRAHSGGTRHLHVVEDDVLFARRLPAVLAEIVASRALEQFDLVFLDTVVPVSIDLVRNLKRFVDGQVRRDASGRAVHVAKFAVIDFGGREFAGASSYLVRAGSIGRIASLLEAEAASGPSTPVDLFYSRLAASGALRAAFVLPFATAVQPSTATATTIEGREGGEAVRFACDLLRYALFVDCEWSEARRAIVAFDPVAADDPSLRLVGTAFALAANPAYLKD
jgi:hypothetical protein